MGLLGSLGGELAGSLAGGLIGHSKEGGAIGRTLGGFLPFATGGKVPGRKHAPVKAMVHGGEVVLPVGVPATKAQKAAIRKRGGKI